MAVSELATMLTALGLPNVSPEPEVLAADLARIHCRSLASIIADLLTANEPMLFAEADGGTVTVREVGGGVEMRVTVAMGAGK